MEELSYVWMKYGLQFVVTTGIIKIRLLYVINLDTLLMVWLISIILIMNYAIIIGAVPASGYYSENVWAIGIINPKCTGNESSILNCSHNQTGSCSPSHDASVICQSKCINISCSGSYWQ